MVGREGMTYASAVGSSAASDTGSGPPRSTDSEKRPTPRHVACVMDGNGRWAAARSLPRTEGHRAAESTAIDVIEAARSAGVEWLSLYAFSTENRRRPDGEVGYLMRLVRRVVRKHAPLLHAGGSAAASSV